MPKKLTSTTNTKYVRDIAEGSPDSREVSNPLRTMTFPIFKHGTDAPPSAETGLISAVLAQAEGHDKHESQDASRTPDENESTPVPQPASEKQPVHTPSVLIVEDTTELAEVIQATLERMNMTTVHETHGGKALTRYNDSRPDIVLLDIGLPDMTGWKFLETIKETKHDKLPIIIVITAYGDPANRLIAKLQGVHDYLIKPFTADEVERVVGAAIRGTTTA